jgi:hypothetical protein
MEQCFCSSTLQIGAMSTSSIGLMLPNLILFYCWLLLRNIPFARVPGTMIQASVDSSSELRYATKRNFPPAARFVWTTMTSIKAKQSDSPESHFLLTTVY